MKVLLLSCPTGEGHDSCARAVQDELTDRGIESVLADPTEIGRGKRRSARLAALYNGLIRRTPALFGAVYALGVVYDASRLPSPVYLLNASYADKMLGYLQEQGFGCVICTHLFGMQVMTRLKKTGCALPVYGVLTDYTAIPFLRETALDGYFVGLQEVGEELAKKKIDPNKIFITGIPVRRPFSLPLQKEDARNALALPSDAKMILLMSGGVGVGKRGLKKICRLLEKRTDGRYRIFVMTGKNEGLKRELERLFPAGGKTVVLPFTDRVDQYMRAADVVLTKAGGLSTTETAVVGVPLVHLKTIPGCETVNARKFARLGMSCASGGGRQAVRLAMQLAEDAERADRMRRMQKKYVPSDSARQIVDIVLGAKQGR